MCHHNLKIHLTVSSWSRLGVFFKIILCWALSHHPSLQLAFEKPQLAWASNRGDISSKWMSAKSKIFSGTFMMDQRCSKRHTTEPSTILLWPTCRCHGGVSTWWAARGPGEGSCWYGTRPGPSSPTGTTGSCAATWPQLTSQVVSPPFSRIFLQQVKVNVQKKLLRIMADVGPT